MKKTPLKRRSSLKPKSYKQRILDALWNEVTDAKAKSLNYICQWCGKHGQRDGLSDPWTYLDGHHIQKRSHGILNTKENCYVCHRGCHNLIEDNGIDVKKYRDLQEWLSRK